MDFDHVGVDARNQGTARRKMSSEIREQVFLNFEHFSCDYLDGYISLRASLPVVTIGAHVDTD